MSDKTPPTVSMPQTPEQPPQFVDAARRYRLDSRIATGGMGEVWRATDTALDRVVAVKLLKSEYADDATFRTRFEDEARHAAALHHPNVCAVYDVGESPATDGSGVPRPFLIMELVEGQPLSALLRGGRKLDPVVMRDLLAQAADAIGAAHAAGIVHRDVKPANLMVTPDRRVKITDFGIARASDGLGLTGTGQVMGTPQYLSPEQARGNPATAASDVYSLGVVAWECLSGYRPFDKGSPVATALAHLNEAVPPLADDVPRDLALVIERALAKDPAERYADGAELAAALRDPATAATQVVRGLPGGVLPGVALGAGAGAAAAAAAARDENATAVMRGVPDPPDTPAEPVRLAPTPVPPGPTRRDERPGLHPGWIAAAVIALALVGLLLYTQLADTNADEPDAPPPSATPPSTPDPEPSEEPPPTQEPETIDLDEGDYVGRPIDDVLSDLRDLGLDPSPQAIENPGDEEPQSVASLTPTQGLGENDVVDVRYYDEVPEPEPTPEPTPSPSPEEPDQNEPDENEPDEGQPQPSGSNAPGSPGTPTTPTAPTDDGGASSPAAGAPTTPDGAQQR